MIYVRVRLQAMVYRPSLTLYLTIILCVCDDSLLWRRIAHAGSHRQTLARERHLGHGDDASRQRKLRSYADSH